MLAARWPVADRHCPLCGGAERYYSFLAGDERFDECRACGLLSHFAVSPGPGPGAAEAPGAPDGQHESQAIALSLLERLRRYVSGARPRLGVAGEPPPGFLAEAERLGFDAARIVVPGGAPGRFEAVVVLHDLENQPAPVGYLEELRAALVEGGVLALLSRQLVKASWQAQGHAILRRRQRHSFSDTNLQSAAWKAGFKEVVVQHIPGAAPASPGGWLEEAVLLLGRAAPRRDRPLVSVIVPVFNEASSARQVLETLAAKRLPGSDLEIIVVESNSTDGSREVVSAYLDRPGFRVLFEDRPRGKGFAVRTGLQHVSGDVIIIQDADLEYDFLDYDMLVEPVLSGRSAFVLGTRHAGHWKIRRFASSRLADLLNMAHWALATAMNLLYRQAMTDPFTMFKVFRSDCLTGLSFECDRFDFDIELVCKLLRKGYRPLEIPVNYRSRSFEEGKKVRMFRDPPTWVRAMLRYRKAPVVHHPWLEGGPR
jgi:hypothetical protein